MKRTIGAMALSVILIAMTLWRRSPDFGRSVLAANTLLMAAGLVLVGYQMTGFLMERAA